MNFRWQFLAAYKMMCSYSLVVWFRSIGVADNFARFGAEKPVQNGSINNSAALTKH